MAFLIYVLKLIKYYVMALGLFIGVLIVMPWLVWNEVQDDRQE